MPNKIFAGPADIASPLLVEALCAAETLPGQIVSRDSGEFAIADGSGEVLVALEYGVHVDEKGSTDTAYAVGDLAIAAAPRSGEFYWVRSAAGEYEAGDLLEVGAVGRVAALNEGAAQFSADEDVTAEAGDLILCRKL